MAFRGRGNRDGPRRREDEPRPEWNPKSDIGRKVKAGEILSLEDIYALGKPVMEAEIIDHLMPDLSEETLEIMNTQRMTDNGRKAQFRAIVLVGDRKGHFGIGAGKSEEVRPAIEAAAKNARRNMVCVPLGCGSWECGCKTRHSLPIKVIGKNGSVEVTLKPAPRGLGIAANPVVRKVLQAAGVKDAWSFSRGHTENVFNMACAVANALESLNTMRYKGDWKEMSSAHVEEPVQPKEAPVSA
ncbi:MAG: 30S ribosomal protein S5 [Candidatus Micrarchaeota archaeon]|nr:30S ribosomal protein S5 [Candidatus Micrarchaeota archaeon]